MTRQELMEKMYMNNPQVSAGEICLKLAQRFPRWQGNYYKMAVSFIKQKKIAYIAQKKARKNNKVEELSLKQAEEFCSKFNFHGMQWNLPI